MIKEAIQIELLCFRIDGRVTLNLKSTNVLFRKFADFDQGRQGPYLP